MHARVTVPCWQEHALVTNSPVLARTGRVLICVRSPEGTQQHTTRSCKAGSASVDEQPVCGGYSDTRDLVVAPDPHVPVLVARCMVDPRLHAVTPRTVLVVLQFGSHAPTPRTTQHHP